MNTCFRVNVVSCHSVYCCYDGMECHVIVHVTVEEYVSSLSRVTVENAYLEEKEDACNALGEIAVQTG